MAVGEINRVAIGGGRGLATLIEADAQYEDKDNIAAVITTSDAGGDSKRWIRLLLGSLAWGDLRKAAGPLGTNPYFNRLKEYRFPKGSGKLKGLTVGEMLERSYRANFGVNGGDYLRKISQLEKHDHTLSSLMSFEFNGNCNGIDGEKLEGACMGNVILVALQAIHKDVNAVADNFQRLFAVRGRLIPVSLEPGTLVADIRKLDDPDYRKILLGEDKLDDLSQDQDYDQNMWVYHLSHAKQIPLNPRAKEYILGAKRITLAAGSPYGSVIAPCLTEDFDFVLGQASGEGEIVVNIMGGPGEGFNLKTASSYLQEIKSYVPHFKVSRIFLNDHTRYSDLPWYTRKRYAKTCQFPIEADKTACKEVYPEAEILVLPLAATVPKHGWIGHDTSILGYHLNH